MIIRLSKTKFPVESLANIPNPNRTFGYSVFVGIVVFLSLTGSAVANSDAATVRTIGNSIEAELVPISEDLDIAAKNIYYYRTFVIGRFSRKKTTKEGVIEWLTPSTRGLVVDVLPDHIFVPIGGGGNVYGFCAVYRPKLNEATVEEHRFFNEVEAWELGTKFDTRGETVLFDIPYLYKAYSRSLDKRTIKKTAAVGIYLFYLIRISSSTTFSLDEINNIYLFETPVAFFDSGVFKEAIEISWTYRSEMMGGPETRTLLSLFPRGGLIEIEDGYVYGVYTWEPGHRRLLLWYFVFRGGELVTIHEIVMVTHI